MSAVEEQKKSEVALKKQERAYIRKKYIKEVTDDSNHSNEQEIFDCVSDLVDRYY